MSKRSQNDQPFDETPVGVSGDRPVFNPVLLFVEQQVTLGLKVWWVGVEEWGLEFGGVGDGESELTFGPDSIAWV